MDILQALGLITVIAYAIGEGFTHAILYGRKGHESFKWNEHLLFIFQRGMFLLIMILPAFDLSVLSGWLCFPFFHNGMYYTQRDRIDGSYPNRWWDMTKDSSATFNFSVPVRTTCAAVGLVLFVLLQIL